MDLMKMSFDGGQELCFDKSDFEKPNFSVDSFLDRRGTNFETLRDDLGQYLKELRSAMIELINQDYSDFVNLSSNLIGLDKSITKLKVPLAQFKEEILQVKGSLDEAIDELTVQLQSRDQLRQSRSSLAHLQTLITLLNKMDCVLHSQQDDSTTRDVNLERITMQLSRSLVCLANCRDLSNELVKKHEEYELELFSRLDTKFLTELNNEPGANRATAVLDCLRIYSCLDKFRHAENLVRTRILSSQLTEKITEQAMRSGSATEMFNAIFAFITHDKSSLKLLLGLTSSEPLNKFDFLLNSFWPEVCDRLINNTNSLFAPGNPDEFYVKYKSTMKFLDKIEIQLGSLSKVELFRSRADYKNFMNKWNLPVYYQIRFQEIAGSVEEVMELGKMADKANEGSEFQLKVFSVTWEAVQKCWQPGVFLPQLTHRFWKLTLQLIARLQVWSSNNVEKLRDEGEGMLFLACLHYDLKLFSSKLPTVFDFVSTSIILSESMATMLKGNLEESKTKSEEQCKAIIEKIVEMGNCRGEITKSVTDIPRIYRRTNREVPTRAGAYVPRFLQAAKDIGHSPKFTSTLNKEERGELVFKLVSSITDTYLSAVKDLLTSVQKTEDSLRRLKQIRDKSSISNQSSSAGGQVSDDDKIRIQILQDCREFQAQIEALGIKSDSIPALCELSTLVEKSVNVPKN